jgi:hypothetical protein
MCLVRGRAWGARLELALPRLVQRVVQASEHVLGERARRRLAGEGGRHAVAPQPQRVEPGRERGVHERADELRASVGLAREGRPRARSRRSRPLRLAVCSAGCLTSESTSVQGRLVAASRDSHTTCDEGSAAFPRRTLLRSLAHLGALTHGTCRPCGSNCSRAETPPCMQAKAEGCMSVRALVCVRMGRARLRARHAGRQRRAQQPGRARSRLHHLARAAHAAKRLSLITRLLPRAWMRSCCTAVQTRKENWGKGVPTPLPQFSFLVCTAVQQLRIHAAALSSTRTRVPHRRARQAG